MGKSLQSLFYLAWLCILVSSPSSLKAECPVTATGVCTPGVEETIVEDIVETTEHGADGYTIITETTTTTTTTTVTTEDSGDILDGDNGFVQPRYEGDMDQDWGGQGPASMPSGSGCYELGTDKCAQITGSGNSTSTQGVSGMGTTFIQTVDISSLDIENGGRTNYTIKVDKRDAQDRIYMHITGKNGNTSVFAGTDILSESGVTSGYQEYTGGFDFAGTITRLTIEIGGRDINMAIGPLFDSVSINVLYNVVETIVNQTITTVEMWVAMGGSTETEVIDIVENIFEHNDIVIDGPNDDMYFEPEFDEPDMDVSYETVEMEMEIPSFEMDFEMDMPDMPAMEMEEIEVVAIEFEMEMEMEMELEMPEMDMPEPDMNLPEPEMEAPQPEMEEVQEEPMPEPEMEEPESQPEVEEVKDETTKEASEEPAEDVADEPEAEESVSEAEADEEQPENMEKPKDKGEADKSKDDQKPVKKQEQKEKAAKKIVKKMGDKGRYDSANQTKTLIVMQVLGDTKTFFETQQQLEDRVGFFTDMIIPDTKIEDNNMAGYFLFVGSEGLMNQIEESQWQN
jgi:outer membrane biosynthesis protein TonB